MTKEREEEREIIRKENMRLREQVHAMLEQRRSGTSRPKRRATSTGFSRQGILFKIAIFHPNFGHIMLNRNMYIFNLK
jgi:hypothetical protein